MRKVLLVLAPMVLLVFASSAFADTIDYTVTSSLEGQSFTFTFSEPSVLTSLDTFTTANFTGGGMSLTGIPAEIEFFSSADGGLFDIIVNIEGMDTFELFGSSSFTGTGPFTLLTGTFPLDPTQGFGDLVVNDSFVANLDGGTVTAVVATPEPATLALVGSGLFALGALRRKKRAA